MIIKKSLLNNIILEEIIKIEVSSLKDNAKILKEFETEEDKKKRWKTLLATNPNHPGVPEGFRKTYLGIMDKARKGIDILMRDDEPAPASGKGCNSSDGDESDLYWDLIAAYKTSIKLDVFKGVLGSTSLSEKSINVLSAGAAVIIPNRAIFQIPDPEYWSKDSPSKLPQSDLSGCEAVAHAVIAGIIYSAIYKVYSSITGKADAALKVRLGRITGARRLNIIAALLTPERAKKMLSIVFTRDAIRKNDAIKSEIERLSDLFCNVDSLDAALDSVEEALLGSPAFVVELTAEVTKDMAEIVACIGGVAPPPSAGGSASPPEPEASKDCDEFPAHAECLKEGKVIARGFKGYGSSHTIFDRTPTNLGKNPFQPEGEAEDLEKRLPVKISRVFKK